MSGIANSDEYLQRFISAYGKHFCLQINQNNAGYDPGYDTCYNAVYDGAYDAGDDAGYDAGYA